MSQIINFSYKLHKLWKIKGTLFPQSVSAESCEYLHSARESYFNINYQEKNKQTNKQTKETQSELCGGLYMP